MLILLTVAALSVLCNGAVFAMLRDDTNRRNFVPAPAAWDIEIPDLTFDSRGMV